MLLISVPCVPSFPASPASPCCHGFFLATAAHTKIPIQLFQLSQLFRVGFQLLRAGFLLFRVGFQSSRNNWINWNVEQLEQLEQLKKFVCGREPRPTQMIARPLK